MGSNLIQNDFEKNKKSSSVLETIQLLRRGKNVEEIARERNFVISTIESHFAQAIKENLIQIDEVKKIADYFPKELNEIRFAAIKEKVPEDISYGKLSMVQAWLQKEKN